MFSRKHWLAAAAFPGIACIVWFFQAHIPLMADNYVFSRLTTPGFGEFYAGSPLTSMSEMTMPGAFRQACDMYFNWCGRFMGNLAVYLFFLLPRPLYACLSGLLFGLLVFLLLICIHGRQWRRHMSAGWVLGVAALLWLGMPSFGEAFLWLSVGGELALIAQASVFIPFRLTLEDCSSPRFSFREAVVSPLFFIFCAMAASLDYPTSAALPPTAILCVCWLYYKKRKFPIFLACGSLGLLIGAWLTLAAPGNAIRLSLSMDPSVHAYMSAGWGERVLNWLTHLPESLLLHWLPLLLLTYGCFLLWRGHGRRWPFFVPQAAWLFLFPALLTHASYLFTAWPPPRAFASTAVQIMVCACIIFQATVPHKDKVFRMASICFAALCLFSVSYEGIKFLELDKIASERERILRNSAGKAAILPAYPPGCGDRYWVLGKYVNDIGPDPDYWVNRAMAAHYGAASVATPMSARKFGWAGILAEIYKGKINITAPANLPAKQLHFYYYGAPALLNVFPGPVSRSLFIWLAHGKTAGLRRLLIPCLLARADVSLKPKKDDQLCGESAPLNFYSTDHLWLAKPGEKALSLDINQMWVESCETPASPGP